MITLHSQPGEEPKTSEEQYLESTAPNALMIAEAERDRAERDRAELDAFLAKRDGYREELAHINMVEYSNERSPKPSPAVTERCEKDRAKIKDKMAAAQAAHDKRGVTSLAGLTDPFIRKLTRSYRDVGTTDTVRKGETPKTMHNVFWRSKLSQGKLNLTIAKEASVTKEMVGQQVNDSVDAQKAIIGVRAARKPGGGVRFPTKAVFNGLSHIDQLDAAGILFTLFGDEIKAALTKRALDGFDDSKAMTAHERREAIEKAEAEILHAERMASFWRRQCLEAGIDPGPGYVSNPIAILDIEPVLDFG